MANESVEAIIYVDGGCKRNGSPDAIAYGSFKVLSGSKIKRHRQMEFPEAKTNNEAEFASLLAALEYICEIEKKTAKPITWIIYMDSALVINQVLGIYKKHKPKFDAAIKAAQAFIEPRNNVTLLKVDDTEMKAVVGH